MENNDISKRTVLVLLVLTLVVSIVGTWTILSQPTTIYRTVELGPPQEGQVNVDITNPPSEPVPQVSDTAGEVKLNIVEG